MDCGYLFLDYTNIFLYPVFRSAVFIFVFCQNNKGKKSGAKFVTELSSAR